MNRLTYGMHNVMVNVAVSLRPSSPPAANLRTTGLLGGGGARGNPRRCGGNRRVGAARRGCFAGG